MRARCSVLNPVFLIRSSFLRDTAADTPLDPLQWPAQAGGRKKTRTDPTECRRSRTRLRPRSPASGAPTLLLLFGRRTPQPPWPRTAPQCAGRSAPFRARVRLPPQDTAEPALLAGGSPAQVLAGHPAQPVDFRWLPCRYQLGGVWWTGFQDPAIIAVSRAGPVPTSPAVAYVHSVPASLTALARGRAR